MIAFIKICILLFPIACFAVDEYEIIIKNHQFIPQNLDVPANKKIKLTVCNQDNEVEEFESFDLRREKIVPANDCVKINLGSLEPGEYKIFGDFHSSTAFGSIIVK